MADYAPTTIWCVIFYENQPLQYDKCIQPARIPRSTPRPDLLLSVQTDANVQFNQEQAASSNQKMSTTVIAIIVAVSVATLLAVVAIIAYKLRQGSKNQVTQASIEVMTPNPVIVTIENNPSITNQV